MIGCRLAGLPCAQQKRYQGANFLPTECGAHPALVREFSQRNTHATREKKPNGSCSERNQLDS